MWSLSSPFMGECSLPLPHYLWSVDLGECPPSPLSMECLPWRMYPPPLPHYLWSVYLGECPPIIYGGYTWECPPLIYGVYTWESVPSPLSSECIHGKVSPPLSMEGIPRRVCSPPLLNYLWSVYLGECLPITYGVYTWESVPSSPPPLSMECIPGRVFPLSLPHYLCSVYIGEILPIHYLWSVYLRVSPPHYLWSVYLGECPLLPSPIIYGVYTLGECPPIIYEVYTMESVPPNYLWSVCLDKSWCVLSSFTQSAIRLLVLPQDLNNNCFMRAVVWRSFLWKSLVGEQVDVAAW